jgi:hypothetical protein
MHLTEQNRRAKPNLAAIEESDAAGAPGTEIEITPGMRDAGVSAFYGPDWGREPPGDAVERIYRAMYATRPLVG